MKKLLTKISMKLIPSGVFGEDFKQSFHKSPQIANNAWKFHICEF